MVQLYHKNFRSGCRFRGWRTWLRIPGSGLTRSQLVHVLPDHPDHLDGPLPQPGRQLVGFSQGGQKFLQLFLQGKKVGSDYDDYKKLAILSVVITLSFLYTLDGATQ